MNTADTRLDPKTFGPDALITGASSGIGREFALQVAARGIRPILVARRHEALESTAHAIEQQTRIQPVILPADLTDPQAVTRLLDQLPDREIGLFIGCAGVGLPGRFTERTIGELLPLIRLKVDANTVLAHAMAKRMMHRKRGGILLVSSMGGFQGVPYIAMNAALESYVLCLGEGLHHELKGHGITVTTLQPGATDTPALAALEMNPEEMPIKPMSAAQCAREGLQALSRGKVSHVAGRMNRIMTKFMTRKVGTWAMGAMIGKKFANAVKEKECKQTG